MITQFLFIKRDKSLLYDFGFEVYCTNMNVNAEGIERLNAFDMRMLRRM